MKVDSDLNGASPQFTLTCISTGGPATTVTWTRDSNTVITEGNETVLNDPVTALYTHTLTVRGKWPGHYKCTVENNKPSTDSKTYVVHGTIICSYRVNGLYHCEIAVSSDNPSLKQSLYIGLYTNDTGKIVTLMEHMLITKILESC